MIVVDNASSDESLAAVEDLPVTAVPLDTNLGFAHGCNIGWRRGGGEYVLFLNPDARIDPASLRRLAQVLDDDRESGSPAPGSSTRTAHSSTRSAAFPGSRPPMRRRSFSIVWPGAELDRRSGARARTLRSAGPRRLALGCLSARPPLLSRTAGRL